MGELEQVTPEVKQVEPTPTEEQVKPTEPEEKPTVSITETEEFRQELRKAIGKSTSSINRQLSLSKAETDAVKATMAELEADYKALEDERFAEDQEELTRHRKARASDRREKDLTLKEAELEGLRWAIVMNNKADELQAQYQVPRDVLEICTTEEQMGKIAKSFPEVTKKAEEKPTEPPKFDSVISSDAGVDLESLTPRQLIQRGIEQARKK